MPKRRFLNAAALLLALSGIGTHISPALADPMTDTSCLPPIDDCQWKWYLQSNFQGPAGEGSQGAADGGSMSYVWRKVPLSFVPDIMLVPLDADAYAQCGRVITENNYSGGGG
jgi:hypothetical protein